jgi:hypothetical protein
MTELEPTTMLAWIRNGALLVVEIGEENTYCLDEFGYRYFSKLNTGKATA